MKTAPLKIPGRFETAPQQLDHTLTLDLSACSPTGATLYESPEVNVCGSSGSFGGGGGGGGPGSGSFRTGFVFDLPLQYEQSNDLSMYPFMTEVDENLQSLSMEKNEIMSSTPCSTSSMVCDELCANDMEERGGMIIDSGNNKQGPTLAELNGNDNVFDDIESIINTDCMLSAANNNSIKKEDDELSCMDKSWKTTSSSLTPASSTMITFTSQSVVATTTSQTNVQSRAAKTNLENLLLGVTPQNSTTPLTVTSPILIQQLTSPQKAAASPTQLLTQVLISSQNLGLIKNEPTSVSVLTPQQVSSAAKTKKASTSTVVKSSKGCSNEGTASKRSVSPGSEGSIEKKWEEIMEYIDEDDLKEPEEKKIKIEPQDVAYNPCDPVDSKDDDFDSDAGSDQENDLSDAESVTSHSSFVEDFIASGRKEKRYFWQYNMQAKGPKGKRLCKVVEPADPHILNDFEDPVFDPELNEMRYKHNGKARRGDGNDITPNPQKLFHLGTELNHLNKKINCMTPVSELPVPARSTSRREKNKYASRACRLKKKAQHEANKLKLHGLQTEHHQLMFVLASIKHIILSHLKSPSVKREIPFSDTLEKLAKDNLRSMIAGHTAEYVNSVLEKVAMGDSTGEIYSDKQDTRTSGGSLVNCDSWA